MKKYLLALGFAAAAALPAQAATVVFTDSFDSNAYGLSVTPAGWTLADGTVDVIGQGTPYDFGLGHGKYLDLDGSTNNAGELSKAFTGLADGQYLLTFELAGSHRASFGASDTVDVQFGSSTSSFTVAANDGFSSFSMMANVVGGSINLMFENRGGDNVGALLDNVQITAVPEPSSAIMLLAGLAALGSVARRRRTS
jgi:PEP-CTERM motif/Protein of unknown function (DUF642)